MTASAHRTVSIRFEIQITAPTNETSLKLNCFASGDRNVTTVLGLVDAKPITKKYDEVISWKNSSDTSNQSDEKFPGKGKPDLTGKNIVD